MVATHTPGPWVAVMEKYEGAWAIGPTDSEERAATVKMWPRPAEEQDANAILIAAVPDLLAALKNILENARLVRGRLLAITLDDWEAAVLAVRKATP